MKDVQCYELFGGITLNNHAFSFFSYCSSRCYVLGNRCVSAVDIPVIKKRLHCFFYLLLL